MNHIYGFINSGSPWSALTVNVSTGRDQEHMTGRARLVIRRGATKLLSHYTPDELRYLAQGLTRAADELEGTARQQNEAWLDRRAA